MKEEGQMGVIMNACRTQTKVHVQTFVMRARARVSYLGVCECLCVCGKGKMYGAPETGEHHVYMIVTIL